jgi:hypothetical protein
MQVRCGPGDTWDGIAFRKLGDSFRASELIAANPRLTEIVMFEGGEVIEIPETSLTLDTSGLPPWRR